MSDIQDIKPQVDFATKEEPSVDMLDTSKNSIVKVPMSHIDLASQAGHLAFKKGQQIPVNDENGEASFIPAKQWGDAKLQGYTLQEPAEYIKNAAEVEAGGQYLRTFGQSALGAATFGTSTLLGIKSGLMDQQKAAAREIANSKTAIAGELTGIIAPALLSEGTSLLGQGARVAGAPVEAVTSAAKILENKFANEATKLGLQNSVAKSLAEKIVPKIAASSAEMVPFVLGNELHEYALGNPEVNAENVMAHLGMGMLFGGSIGAAMGAATLATPMMSKAFSSTVKPLEKMIDKTKNMADLIGLTPKQITNIESKDPSLMKNMVKDHEKIINVMDSNESIAAKVSAEKESFGRRTEEILDHVDSLNKEGAKASDVYLNIAKKLDEEFITPKTVGGKVDPLVEQEISKIRQLRDQYLHSAVEAANNPETNKFTAKELRTVRQNIDETLKFDRNPLVWTIKDEAGSVVRTALRDEIENLANNLSPKLKQELHEVNQGYYRFSKYEDLWEKRLQKENGISLKDIAYASMGHLFGGGWTAVVAGAAAKFAHSDLKRKLVVLGYLDKAINSTEKAIENAAKGFAKQSKMVTPVIFSIASSQLAKSSEGKKPENKLDAYRNIRDRLNDTVNNPDKYMSNTSKQTAVLNNYMPDTMGHLTAKTFVGMQYLQSKLPQRRGDVGTLQLAKDSYVPSTMEMSKFERSLKAVEKPLETVKELENGTFTKEHADALQAVYPELFKQLQIKVMDVVHSNNLPYSKKIQLGMLMNVPSDTSLLPQNILGLQQNFEAQEQSMGNANKPNGAAKSLNVNEDMQSASERVSNHDD